MADKYTLGRFTIAPDDMAQLVLYKNSPFSLITYLRGQENGEILYLNSTEYAKAMGYQTSSKNDELVFKKIENICVKKVTEDENGKFTTKKICEDRLIQPIYKGSIL